MSAIRIQNNGQETLRTTAAFDGIVITAHNHASTGAVDAINETLNPALVRVKLRNTRTGVLCWDLNLWEAYTVFNAGAEKIGDFRVDVAGSIQGRVYDTDKLIQDLSLPLPVYHGYYELTVELGAAAFASGCEADSYITVQYNPTTDAMAVETIVRDTSIDKRVETISFNGAQKIILMDEIDPYVAGDAWANLDDITQISYTANEQNQSFSFADLVGNHMTYLEDPNAYQIPQLIVHDGHLLTNGELMIEGSATDALKCYIVEYRKSVTATASTIKQNQNETATFNNLD